MWLIRISLYQSINIEQVKYVYQFKINTHRCCNQHLSILDGLSVVQWCLGHAMVIVFFTQIQWHATNVKNNWQLAVLLPSSRGSEFDPRLVHDNLSVPLWVISVSLCKSIKIKPTNVLSHWLRATSRDLRFWIENRLSVWKNTCLHCRQWLSRKIAVCFDVCYVSVISRYITFSYIEYYHVVKGFVLH